MKKDPFHITYDDLIEWVKNSRKYMEQTYPRKKIEGRISDYTATKNMEITKRLITMLTKAKKDPQLDLYQLFENTK